MTSIVDLVKNQYARFIEARDWRAFKIMAEYYFRSAAKLKKKDIDVPEAQKLWIRNSLKRLFLGIAFELILKAFYLKEGYCINKPKQGLGMPCKPIYRIDELDRNDFDHRDTYTLGPLIDNISSVRQFQNHSQIERAFRIAMVFRNKEGHVTFPSHNFDPCNYSDIENGLFLFYKEVFGQEIIFRVSMEPNELGIFKIK